MSYESGSRFIFTHYSSFLQQKKRGVTFYATSLKSKQLDQQSILLTLFFFNHNDSANTR